MNECYSDFRGLSASQLIAMTLRDNDAAKILDRFQNLRAMDEASVEEMETAGLSQEQAATLATIGPATANLTRGQAAQRLDGEYTNIFVPTTPIPTNGFYLMVPTKELIPLDMTVGDGMKLLISGGAVTPDTLPIKQP